jgi:hypothetical protein
VGNFREAKCQLRAVDIKVIRTATRRPDSPSRPLHRHAESIAQLCYSAIWPAHGLVEPSNPKALLKVAEEIKWPLPVVQSACNTLFQVSEQGPIADCPVCC